MREYVKRGKALPTRFFGESFKFPKCLVSNAFLYLCCLFWGVISFHAP